MYLETFRIPIDKERSLIDAGMAYNGGAFGYIDNTYPCGIFSEKLFREVNFAPVTILYGGNGSGKSTLLNLIAQKLRLIRVAPFNSSQLFDSYVEACSYETGYDDEGLQYQIPAESRIITSDDIFDYMLTVRTNNDEISENIETAREEWAELKFGKTVKLRGLDDYEALRMQVLARNKNVSRRQFIRKTAGQEVRLNSNGETALRYFERKMQDDTLYCLDEPENSMSPKMQLELVEMLETMARWCGCQFIIATHSPFLLAIENARIYDLDETPVTIKNWWELENTRIYYEFFKEHEALFR